MKPKLYALTAAQAPAQSLTGYVSKEQTLRLLDFLGIPPQEILISHQHQTAKDCL